MTQNGKQQEPRPEQALTPRDPRLSMPIVSGGLAPRDYGELVDFAKMVSSSGMVPKSYEGNVGAVLVAVQMGAELGLAPMSAIRSICVINGMPSVWGDGMLALCVSHPDCEDVIEKIDRVDGDLVAVCTAKRRGRAPVVRTFSWTDAKRARLDTKKGPWQEYPQRMLQMRARSWCLRDAFPDVLRGIRATEEVRDSIDMGRADYINPSPGPEINPATAVPPAGTTHFGKKPPKNAPRETSREDAPGEPRGQSEAKAPASATETSTAPAESAPATNYDDIGPGEWTDEPEEETRPSTPEEQGEAEGAGQSTMFDRKAKI